MNDGTEYFGAITSDEAARFMSGNRHPIREGAAKLVGRRNVTDLGCGKGIRIAELYKPEQYVGVDCSRELIEIAQRDNPGFRFYTSGILQYLSMVPDGAIEVALMISVLEHIPELEAAQAIYNEARRASKELLVGWHTVPNANETKTSRVQTPELISPIWQNKWKRGSFADAVQVYPFENAELWVVHH